MLAVSFTGRYVVQLASAETPAQQAADEISVVLADSIV
jgi:hypothetical protein